MNQFSALKTEIVQYLHKALAADKVAVLQEFPAARRFVPAREGCIAVGFSSLELPESANPPGQIKLTLRFDILCQPQAKRGCHAVFELLCAALTARATPFPVREIRCGEVRYDSVQDALLLTAQANVQGVLVSEPPEDGEMLQEVLIKTRGGLAG